MDVTKVVDGFTEDDAPPPGYVENAVREWYVDHIASQFHETYERLAPKHGYETRAESAVPWADVPVANKELMRSVVAVLLTSGVILHASQAASAPVTEMISYATSESADELEVRFTYHPPTGDQPDRYHKLRKVAHALASHVVDLCPESRERSLALTNLEQAVMWANAAIARREPRDR